MVYAKLLWALCAIWAINALLALFFGDREEAVQYLTLAVVFHCAARLEANRQ